ncbi:NfeD family protein [Xanthomonas oryzae pv. oryzae]|nr:NfeD family protein [Xanthomonas oryzae pv. oryzae]BAE68451.1 conserved hypothetical protein [Xanthomonas oryzae pv. oryzae MAFF 311018]AXM16922.1 NfeD family protein [Xanthomonas oryzae pv. oryzae]AXM20742.1 NfeD family protein [Xanthomonas oryzae pv. oryzae]AXM25145.1 NfeD family protein [Xanthomonas oryzae pv. oryzae]
MRWDVAVWAVLALLLIAAETLVPGAFLLWMGIAAAVVCVLVLVLPDIALLVQIVVFVVLSFVSVQVYRTWCRGKGRESDRPLLNRRAEQVIGRRVLLDQAIDDGRGRVKVDDAFWVVAGPDLPAGTPVRIVGVDGRPCWCSRSADVRGQGTCCAANVRIVAARRSIALRHCSPISVIALLRARRSPGAAGRG